MNSRTRSEEHEPDLVSLAVAAESLGVSVKTIGSAEGLVDPGFHS